jgi:hypothetical protein
MADDWATPGWLMRLFRDFRWFDPCPLNQKALLDEGLPAYDGLEVDWHDFNYVNPPYSDPLPWCEKAVAEFRKGKTVVLLVKHDPTTKWYRLLIDAGAHILYFGERLRYSEMAKAAFCSDLVVLSRGED